MKDRSAPLKFLRIFFIVYSFDDAYKTPTYIHVDILLREIDLQVVNKLDK